MGLLLPTFLETLDYTVVATAQPRIASSFNRLDLQSWIGTSYILTSTIFIPVFGSLSDSLGRHDAVQVGLAFFVVGSAICTGAQSLSMLLVGRGISGIGAAGIISVARVIASDSESIQENAFVTCMLVVAYTAGFSSGPNIGGALVSVSFRWIFAINLPSGVVCSIAIFLFLRPFLKGPVPSPPRQDLPTRTEEQPASSINSNILGRLIRVDWIGALLFIAGGIPILTGLSIGSDGSNRGFAAPAVVATLIIGGLSFGLMVLWELSLRGVYEDDVSEDSRWRPWKTPRWLDHTTPLLPIRIYGRYDMLITSFGAMVSGMVLFSCFYFLAIYFSVTKGLNATDSGVQLLFFSPGIGGGVAISVIMLKLVRQPKYPAILGTAVLSVSIGLMVMALELDQEFQLKMFLLMSGIGVGLCFSLSLQAKFSQPASRIAVVVSMNLFFFSAGGTVGLAQLATVLNSKVNQYVTYALTSPTSPLTSPQRQSLAAAFVNGFGSVGSIYSLDPVTRAVVQDAFRRGCMWSFISLIPWCVIAFFSSLGLSSIPESVLKGGDAVVGPGQQAVRDTGGCAVPVEGLELPKRAEDAGANLGDPDNQRRDSKV
ncbi:hypothetical protein FRB96_008935 [Tulasnella sp. 330]|nr:hypothetical protein FRB96_008935 [Tulasnella sp. 330]